MKSILERPAPTSFGDGETSRDFTYVEDLAALNWKAAKAAGVAAVEIELNGPARTGDVRGAQSTKKRWAS